MFIEDFRLEGGLNEKQIKLMIEKALDLTEKTGIHIPHKGILDLLSNYKGVKIEKQIVKFNKDLVLNALKEVKYPLPDYVKDNWVVSAGAHQTKIFDLDSKELRETTLRDLIEMVKLGDSFNTVGPSPIVPLDQPGHLQEILMYKIAWEYSRFGSNDMFEHNPKSTVESANYIYEMAKTANKWFSLGVYMISPRTFYKDELEVIYRFLDKGVPMWAGTMPIAGVNAPITMIGAMLQAIFETFGCITMLNLINNKSYSYIQVIDNFIAHSFDWKFGTFVLGSAEDVRCSLNKISIHKYLNMPFSIKSLFTASKQPDAQAAFEIGTHTLIAALAGARVFRCGGLLSSAIVYSAEMLVMVCEMVEYIKNILKEEEFSEERLMVDEIAAVEPGQSFIARKSTIENFRKEYWEPELFVHSNLGQWQEMGSKSIYEYANEIAKKRIREHTYQIDEDIKKELDRIYKRAKTDQKLIDSFK